MRDGRRWRVEGYDLYKEFDVAESEYDLLPYPLTLGKQASEFPDLRDLGGNATPQFAPSSSFNAKSFS